MDVEITDDQFFKQLYCVIGELHQIAQTQLAKQATFRGQGRLIFLLANNEGVSQRELATLARVKPGSISEVLERLEKDQLVERWRDQQDRRIVRVKLTAKGQQVHLKNLRARQEFERQLLRNVSATERAAFVQVLQKIHREMTTHYGELMPKHCKDGEKD